MHASQPELNRSVAGIVHVAYLFRLQEGGGWVSGVEFGEVGEVGGRKGVMRGDIRTHTHVRQRD